MTDATSEFINTEVSTVWSEGWIVKKILLMHYYEMLEQRQKYENAKLNQKLDLRSYDKWVTSLLKLFSQLEFKMEKYALLEKKDKKIKQTVDYLNSIRHLNHRPNTMNIEIATRGMVYFLEKLKLIDIEVYHDPANAIAKVRYG